MKCTAEQKVRLHELQVVRVTIPAGETTGSFAIPIVDDLTIEGSETFRINLQAKGVSEFDSNHLSILDLIVTILDNEAPFTFNS